MLSFVLIPPTAAWVAKARRQPGRRWQTAAYDAWGFL